MQQGKLVPDEVVIDLLREEVAMYAARQQSILLDGFPRTLNQAIMLNDFFQVDTVISLQIPHEIIMERMSNRWIHLQSGRTYSYDYNPPRVKGQFNFHILFSFSVNVLLVFQLGIDDVTGEALVQREDDKPEVVKKRLDSYEAMTSPLIEYYKSNPLTTVGEFAGTESNVIYPVVKSFLIEKMHLQTTK